MSSEAAVPDICLGRVFFNCHPTNDTHPKVIASDPSKNEQVAVVGLSSKPGDGDVGYTVEPGDHPAISHRSYVRCDFSVVTTAAILQAKLAKGEIRISQCLSTTALTKVQRALDESRRPSRELQKLLRHQGFTKPRPKSD